MRLLLLLSMVLVLSFSATARTKGGKVYWNASGGYAMTSSKINISGQQTAQYNIKPKGFGFGGGVSYAMTDSMRVGLDMVYLVKLRDKGKSSSGGVSLVDKSYHTKAGGFATIYYDLQTGAKMWPFFLVGVGAQGISVKEQISMTNYDTSSSKKTKMGIAYQGGAGLAYSLSSAVDLEIGYKLIASPTAKSITSNNDVVSLTIGNKPSYAHYGFVGGRFSF